MLSCAISSRNLDRGQPNSASEMPSCAKLRLTPVCCSYLAYRFRCIQINCTDRQLMAVGLIDKNFKNAVRMSVSAADYSWGSLMVTGPCGLGPAISTLGGVRRHNFDCNFYCTVKCTQGAGGIDRLEFGDGCAARGFWRKSRTSC